MTDAGIRVNDLRIAHLQTCWFWERPYSTRNPVVEERLGSLIAERANRAKYTAYRYTIKPTDALPRALAHPGRGATICWCQPFDW